MDFEQSRWLLLFSITHKLLFLVIAVAAALSGCTGGIDYVVHGEGDGETVYITETETEIDPLLIPVPVVLVTVYTGVITVGSVIV